MSNPRDAAGHFQSKRLLLGGRNSAFQPYGRVIDLKVDAETSQGALVFQVQQTLLYAVGNLLVLLQISRTRNWLWFGRFLACGGGGGLSRRGRCRRCNLKLVDNLSNPRDAAGHFQSKRLLLGGRNSAFQPYGRVIALKVDAETSQGTLVFQVQQTPLYAVGNLLVLLQISLHQVW